jgi:hypothetical protein
MKIRLLIAAASVAMAAICSAIPAHADQDGYLTILTDNGAHITTPQDVTEAVQAGHWVCQQLYAGLSEEQVESILLAGPTATPQKIQLAVTAAHSQSCPNA